MWLSSGLWLFLIIIYARFVSIFPESLPKCQFNTLLLMQSQSSQNKSVHLKLEIKKMLFFTVSVLLMLGNVFESINLWRFCGSWLARGLPGMQISPISTHYMATYQSTASFVMLRISMTCSILFPLCFVCCDLIRFSWNISASSKKRLLRELTLNVCW